jgi:hypothetical protein
MLPRELTLEAAGRVLVEGALLVRTRETAEGAESAATAVELPEGRYSVRFTPRSDGAGYDVDILLQGAVQVR